MLDTKALASAFNRKRTSEGLSLRGIAAQTGISASTLMRVADGKLPDVTTLEAVCKWVGVSIDDFFVDSVVETKSPYTALDTYILRELFAVGMSDGTIEILDRYVKTISDERDKFYDTLKITFECMEKWAALLEDSEDVDNIVAAIDAHLSEFAPSENKTQD